MNHRSVPLRWALALCAGFAISCGGEAAPEATPVWSSKRPLNLVLVVLDTTRPDTSIEAPLSEDALRQLEVLGCTR